MGTLIQVNSNIPMPCPVAWRSMPSTSRLVAVEMMVIVPLRMDA